MFNEQMFLNHISLMGSATEGLNKIEDAFGVSEINNGLYDLYNDMAALYADLFCIDEPHEDEFFEAFWDMIYEGSAKTAIGSELWDWSEFYQYFSNVLEVTPNHA